MEYKIGFIGCGTVGQGLLEILDRKREHLRDAYDFETRLVAVSDKLKGSLAVSEGIDIRKLLGLLAEGKPISTYEDRRNPKVEVSDALDMIEKIDADIIAELTYTDIKTAEPATGYIRKALRTGKHVVTSNKGPAALHYKELAGLALKNGLQFRFEGTVMSGTPVFHLFENGLAGNDIREIKGILNGTTNFILSQMEQDGMEYSEALALAQKLGYAEADPTADVEGFDALAKIVILSNVLMGGNVQISEVQRTGISGISRADVEAAKAAGFRYKLIARTVKRDGKIEASISPQKIPLSDPLAAVMGAQNALTLRRGPHGEDHHPGSGRRKNRDRLCHPLGYAGHTSLRKEIVFLEVP